MPTHRLLIASDSRAAVPGTSYALAISSVRERIGSTSADAFPRSMTSALFTLVDGDRQLAQQHAVDGARFRLGPLQVHFTGRGDDASTLVVDVTT